MNKREEQIKEAAKTFIKNLITMNNRPPHRPDVLQYVFEEACKWADKNPSTAIEDQKILWSYLSEAIELQFIGKLNQLDQALIVATEALEDIAGDMPQHMVDVWDSKEEIMRAREALEKIKEILGE